MLELRYLNDDKVYPIEFGKDSAHVVTIKGEFDVKTKGFYLSRIGKNDNWDYTDFKTVYKLEDGLVKFSDDGSIYIPPKKNVYISINWDDGGNVLGVRPDEVEVKVYENGKSYCVVTLSEENGWNYTIENVLASSDFFVACDGIPDYDIYVSGCSIMAHTDYPVPEEVTIDDLAEAITEVFEMVAENTEEIVTTQLAVAEIYEMIAEE